VSGIIDLRDVSITGIDTDARAATLRQWFTRRKSFRPVHIPILRDITFQAKPGDRVGIVGRNGSGKSSLLKVISGNYPIHSGFRHVQGTIVPIIEMGAGFDPLASGRENIELTYAFRGKLRHYSPTVAAQIIDFAELDAHIDRPLQTYSSGMVARLAFASAIFQNPDILLLDEVLATGDGGFIQKSYDAIKRKIDQAAITILVSHDLPQMMSMCNRFILLHEGRILNDGSVQEITRQYEREILRLPSHAVHDGHAEPTTPGAGHADVICSTG
jgi:ABC-type polysaccharide/polyol phosphate transport system ATPase subunit